MKWEMRYQGRQAGPLDSYDYMTSKVNQENLEEKIYRKIITNTGYLVLLFMSLPTPVTDSWGMTPRRLRRNLNFNAHRYFRLLCLSLQAGWGPV